MSPPWRASIPDAKPRVCSDRNGRATLVAPWPALPAAVLMMFFPQLAMAAGSSGQDLMATGNGTVKATFGKDSSAVKWVILAEVLVGAVMYMMTKNVKFLAGFAILSVFIAVGMAVVGL
ncbi:type IV conjugative transfer system pilin TraA [Escherichia coli]|nr:type IV conjugative transfer system pilin TraA [Escherichia coli]